MRDFVDRNAMLIVGALMIVIPLALGCLR